MQIFWFGSLTTLPFLLLFCLGRPFYSVYREWSGLSTIFSPGDLFMNFVSVIVLCNENCLHSRKLFGNLSFEKCSWLNRLILSFLGLRTIFVLIFGSTSIFAALIKKLFVTGLEHFLTVLKRVLKSNWSFLDLFVILPLGYFFSLQLIE